MRKFISGVFHLVGLVIFSCLLLLAGAAAGIGGLLYLAYEHDPKIASKLDRTLEIFEEALQRSEAVWREGETPKAALAVEGVETKTAEAPNDAVTAKDSPASVVKAVIAPADVQVQNPVEQVKIKAADSEADSDAEGAEKVD